MEMSELINRTAQIAVTLLGSGIGTFLVGLVFKRFFDRELEKHKSLLSRSAGVHNRIVDSLTNLYAHLHEASGLFQRMTARGRSANEATPEEYELLLEKEMEAAREEYVKAALLLPEAVVADCKQFFDSILDGRMDFSFTRNEALTPEQRAGIWREAADKAHKQVPAVLSRIESAFRILIHGEAT